jgi:ribosomal-protein-alanine N-acetyltransferase
MSVPRQRLDGEATAIRPTDVADLDEWAELVAVNRTHTARWDPKRPDRFYTRHGQLDVLRRDRATWDADMGFAFVVLDRTAGDRMIGRIALSNVVRGAWRNATLGWWVAADACGRGHATSAARLVQRFAFEIAGLHRIQPAVVPRNTPSVRVAEKAGFRREGRALRYLEINGAWEDHDLYAMTLEDWQARTG